MSKPSVPKVAVLGAGPIGLEAALYARHLGWSVTVYEKGRVGEYLHRWGHVRLFSPFGQNSTSLGREAAKSAGASLPGLTEIITGREHLARYLEPLARSELLKECIRTGCEVVRVGRSGWTKTDDDYRRVEAPFRLLLRWPDGGESVETAQFVLDCTGIYGQHAWLGDGGIPAIGERAAAPHIAYGLEDILGERRGHYAGRTTIVVGSGYSAATTVSHLATLAESSLETWVIWLARSARTQPLARLSADPLRERDRLAARANTLATRGEGNVEYHANCKIEAIEVLHNGHAFRVRSKLAGLEKVWEAERLIGNVGYVPDISIFGELPIPVCPHTSAPLNLAPLLGRGQDFGRAIATAEPGYFILGAKSFGRHTGFLLHIGLQQVREAFAVLTGKSGLDLYRVNRAA